MATGLFDRRKYAMDFRRLPRLGLLTCLAAGCSPPATNSASAARSRDSIDLETSSRWMQENVPHLSYFQPFNVSNVVHVADVHVTNCTLKWALARMFKGPWDSVQRLYPFNHLSVSLSTVQMSGLKVEAAKLFGPGVWRVAIPTTVVDSTGLPVEESLFFGDSISAQRVERGIYHIAELCGGKKDPF